MIEFCMYEVSLVPRSHLLHGMKLGLIEWWVCNTNVRKARKKIWPRPLDYNHTHFSYLELLLNYD